MGEESSRNAITEEEITGNPPPPSASTSTSRNACIFSSTTPSFTSLTFCQSPRSWIQNAKPLHSASETPKKPYKNVFSPGDGLCACILHLENYDISRVIYYNDFVAINDLYPKFTVHTLLLPRSTKYNLLHSFNAFEDAEFLGVVREEVTILRKLVAKELQRRYGCYSKQDEPQQAVLNGEVDPTNGEELPIGRD
jgi:aprataxin